jgi:hypothetical protein
MMKNRLKSIILAIAVLAIVMVNNIGIGSFDRVDAQPNYVTDQMREFPVTQPIAQIPYTGNPDCKELMSNIRKWGRVNVQQITDMVAIQNQVEQPHEEDCSRQMVKNYSAIILRRILLMSMVFSVSILYDSHLMLNKLSRYHFISI